MYYTSIERMSARYDRMPREYALQADSQETFASWKQRARTRLCAITGLALCERAPLDARMLRSVRKEGYTEEYWTLQSEPGVLVPFYLLRPSRLNGAAMLIPHGHGVGKEETVGNLLNPGVAARNRPMPRPPFAVQLACAGYYVACPDARGTGERREFMHQGERAEDWMSDSHRELQNMALGFGQCMVALLVWDLMRLLDFVSALDGVHPERIGCAGMSGGGQQTLWLAALDDRIRVAVASGYFYGMRDSLVRLPHNCCCNFVPHMWETMDTGDLGALIAPRPLLIESGRHDHLNGERGLENVLPQVEITRRAYALLGAEEKLLHSVHEGGHTWSGQDVVPFLEKWL